ncbi:MAG: hypothetical protein UZ21_OP11001000722 [Microgenomates bacterium OLB22]|nr:MAG: hypothetical protein UZ21_OP11001000722 [Microgenomates bacterium OLB22]
MTEADRKAYVDSYWKAMPDQVPDEYSRPSGAPYTADVEEDTYNLVATSEQGVRIYDNTYPGSEGTDGWKHPATVHG